MQFFPAGLCRHIVPMQHNQWCVTSSAFCVFREESLPWHCCYASPPHWVSLLDQLSSWETATLTFASPPPLSLPGLHRFAPSWVLRLKHACAHEASSRSSSSPSPSLASWSLHPSAEESSAQLGLSQPKQLHQHHSLIRLCSILSIPESIHLSQASQHLRAAHTPSLTDISRANLPCCIPLIPLLVGQACHSTIPLLPSSSSSSSFRVTVQEKAGKLSLLPVKVSFSWAAGLPLSLWRMILWMKTEEMALGELLERLRTVTKSIGGWQQHIQQQLCSLVIALLIAEDCGFIDKGEISICTQPQCHSV